MDLQNKFFSYGALNTLSIFAYVSFFLNRMIQLKNIYDVNLFLILSPLILAAMFYCFQRWFNKNICKKELKVIYYSLPIFLWILMLKAFDLLYNNSILIRSYLNLFSDVIYFIGCVCTVLIFISAAKSILHPIINLILTYLIYGILFLKTLNTINESNGIETFYFVNPYIYLMIANIIIWFAVSCLFDILKRYETPDCIRQSKFDTPI